MEHVLRKGRGRGFSSSAIGARYSMRIRLLTSYCQMLTVLTSLC